MPSARTWLWLTPFCIFALFGALLLLQQSRVRSFKHQLLTSTPPPVSASPLPFPPHYQLGRHFIVGFTDWDSITQLVQSSAIGGIFLTTHNVEGQTLEQVRTQIDRLQAIQTSHGLPPLWISADQEGGVVSRLSPPLPTLPPLSTLVDQTACTESPDSCFTAAEREAVLLYARAQSLSLRELGVNLNLSPVVDIYRGTRVSSDRYTHLELRALAHYPWLVTGIADIYLDELIKAGITPTLKHFPGLGRVTHDTHFFPAHLTTPLAELESSDWLPFQSLLSTHPQTTLMLSHVTLDALDSTTPSSFSPPVIQYLRSRWAADTLLITDDYSMYPVRLGSGVGPASLQALNAGVDLILISYQPELLYPALSTLEQARIQDQLNLAVLAKSDLRLSSRLTSPSAPPPHSLSSPR